MLEQKVIVISPSQFVEQEFEIINKLFEAGLARYHIHKSNATEQSIAEILEGILPKFLSHVSLHSHFHLVLAYGVGGIHYSKDLRHSLADDYSEKVKLYQSFGIKVSADHQVDDPITTDYKISYQSDQTNAKEGIDVYTGTKNQKDSVHKILADHSFDGQVFTL